MEDGPKISTELYGFDLTHPEKIKIGTPVHAKFIEREGKVILGFER